MGRKQWMVAKVSRADAQALADECGMDPLAAMLLMGRGICDPAEAEEFLDFDQQLADPAELKDMDKAVERIRRALEQGEKIAVFGDYDCDGVTAGVVLTTYLSSRGADVFLTLPDRMGDGYGMHRPQIDELHEKKVALIITVDNGIAAAPEIAYAASLGMDVVVTDHHITPEILPEAAAVVDPHRPDEESEFCDWAGVGVAFKLCCAVEGCPCEDLLPRLGDLVAIGTVADVVPLRGENRLLVAKGLPCLNECPRLGIRALLAAAGMEGREITSETLAFGIGPRINAAGRMGDAMRAARLLMTDDPDEADRLARELEEANRERHAVEDRIVREALAQVAADPDLAYRRTLVLAHPGWHPGVLGIAAARLCERTGKPTLLLTIAGGKAHGSARSVEGFHLYDALRACREHLTAFGGHAQAAGLSLPEENIAPFARALETYAAGCGEMPFPPLRLDCKLTPRGVSIAAAQAAEALAPFGQENPSPLFGLFRMTLDDVRPVGGGGHLRLSLSRDGVAVTAMRFSTRAEEFPYARGDCVDLAIALSVGQFQGKPSLSVVVRNIRPSGLDEREVLSDIRLYERYRRGEPLTPAQAERLLPGRDEVGAVFRQLRAADGQAEDSELLLSRTGGTMGLAKVCCALDALEELSLIRREGEPTARWYLNPAAGKKDLTSSTVLQRLHALCEASDDETGSHAITGPASMEEAAG